MKLLPIKIYKRLISPVFYRLLGDGCRYYPNCSSYAEIAISRYGIIKGTALSLKRIFRCHPLSKHQLIDPVP